MNSLFVNFSVSPIKEALLCFALSSFMTSVDFDLSTVNSNPPEV